MIRAVTSANPRTAVLIQSGTPVTMPWVDQASALVHSSYGGNEVGNAIGDVLFGEVNPSGKLPLTIPRRLEDNPAFLNFGSENGRTLYGEDVYVGYRFYEKSKVAPLFPFGHGLSYTTFELGGFHVLDTANGTIDVSLDISNTGALAGSGVAQIYVNQRTPLVNRPPKELKGFQKVALKAGQTKRVTVPILLKYAASYWDEEAQRWIMEKGLYEILVGQSSNDVLPAGMFTIERSSWWSGL